MAIWTKKKDTRIRADTLRIVKEMRPPEERAEEAAGDEFAADAISADLLRALIGNVTIDRKKAMQVPALNASIRLIAEIVSSLPIKLYKTTKQGKVVEIKNDERLKLFNRDTGDTLTPTQFWRAMIEDYYMGGAAYAYINKPFGEMKSVHYVEYEKISVNKIPDPIFKDYRLYCWGKSYEPWEFLKILRKSRDGATGTSVWEESSQQLAAAYYDIKWRMMTAKKGGITKGFIQSERQLSEPQIDSLKESWRRLFESEAENMMVLNKGLEYKSSQHDARAMQQEENRKEDLKEISMLVGVPGAILSGGATQSDYDALIKHGVTPLLTEIETSLDRDVLTLEEQEKGWYWAFDTRELTRGSIKARYEAYESAIKNNWMQPDEVRALEDMEPLGLNFIKLGLDAVLYDPKTGNIVTPNTGETQNLKEGRLENESRNQSGRTPSDGVRKRARENEQTGGDAEGEGN